MKEATEQADAAKNMKTSKSVLIYIPELVIILM